ncbi:MAG: FtsX-like permease family protein [Candidatus Scalindua sp.]|nr:FtsX-like permease family protein [Candidatus Scalindua sp.]MBT5305619.1 FtsX-like permease family protein [Candidatus Scalindua sp.]MBT6225908.1 FtsX-like permease family protein [Candidatus Scalindua sp.]MBT7591554.1 FtsX-like permease family protein [Candidatus Scalindua sp.]
MRNPLGIVFQLSRADLKHEWVLTICLIMAVTAVLSPLMILFGLKFGTIEVMRYRLVQDPRNREIRPLTSKSFTQEWFNKLESRDDVSFIVPTTRQISASVEAQIKDNSRSKDQNKINLDIIPTDDGDRLVMENGASVPNSNQCVLTNMAAEKLDAKIGDTLIVAAKRYKGTRYEKGMLSLKVSGILTDRASTLKSIYVRLHILEAVESYKDGQAVPEYGWEGTTPKAYPLYDGLVVILLKKLNKIDEFKLINNTGFTKIEPLTTQDLYGRAGYLLSPGKSIYLLSTKSKPAGHESVRSIGFRLRGKGATLIPWVSELKAELIDRSDHVVNSFNLLSLSIPEQKAVNVGMIPIPTWSGEIDSDEKSSDTAKWRRIMLPESVKSLDDPVQMRITRGDDSFVFPIQIESDSIPREIEQKNTAFVPARLAGVLNLFKRRNITFDNTSREFILARRGYAGFRLYASTIDDVELIKQYLEGEGIPVHTEAERIRDVTELDKYLTLIFWLITTVGVIGGVATLMASLYASVERKRKDLSILRLIGLSGTTLLRFPIYQGIIIAVGGFGVALVFFESLAWIINSLFSSHLQAEESLCRLAIWHLLIILGATVSVAILAGTVAAWRITRIEPAEALRDE